MQKNKKGEKKVSLNIERIDGETFLNFELSQEIENMFKKQSVEIKKSDSWDTLSFYYIPELTQNDTYKRLLQRWQLVDDFGTSLYSGSVFNIAFLRTVGGSGKIKINNDIGYSAVSLGIERIIGFLKEYYSEYLRDYKVNGHLTLEI